MRNARAAPAVEASETVTKPAPRPKIAPAASVNRSAGTKATVAVA